MPATLAGQTAKCPSCGAVAPVPGGPQSSASEPVPATPTSTGSAGGAPVAGAPVDGAPVVGAVGSSALAGPTSQANPTVQPASPTPAPQPIRATATPPVQPSVSLTGPAAQPHPLDESPQDSIIDFEREPVIGENTATRQLYERITDEVAKVFVGQRELVEGTLVALFCGGHVLIESVPGLGKTLFVRTLGKILGCEFGRIQFTADLMPSDITGSPIFDMKTQEFSFRPGPVFTQLLLADEINRSPAKTHAALLETMQERRVTVDGTTHELEQPFLVVATQNPIESEGTYNLPEAQLDRFLFKLRAEYPNEEQEAKILTMHSDQVDLSAKLDQDIETVTSSEEILRVTQESSKVRVEPVLVEYINKIVRLTRQWPQFYMGASPRAGIGLMQAARTLAAFYGRDYAVPDDVVQLAIPTLRHRVMLTAEAEVEGQKVDDLLRELIRRVNVPRIEG